MYDPAAERERDEQEAAQAREHARQNAAKRGWPAFMSLGKNDVVAWAFEGHEDELEEINQLAARTRAEKEAQAEREDRAQALSAMTRKVLREWDEQAHAERRQKAEAEARKRLGWEAES